MNTFNVHRSSNPFPVCIKLSERYEFEEVQMHSTPVIRNAKNPNISKKMPKMQWIAKMTVEQFQAQKEELAVKAQQKEDAKEAAKVALDTCLCSSKQRSSWFGHQVGKVNILNTTIPT